MKTNNPQKKPFKVGQLVRDTYTNGNALALVLELRWSSVISEWAILVLYQGTGRKEECWACDFKPTEKKR